MLDSMSFLWKFYTTFILVFFTKYKLFLHNTSFFHFLLYRKSCCSWWWRGCWAWWWWWWCNWFKLHFWKSKTEAEDCRTNDELADAIWTCTRSSPTELRQRSFFKSHTLAHQWAGGSLITYVWFSLFFWEKQAEAFIYLFTDFG